VIVCKKTRPVRLRTHGLDAENRTGTFSWDRRWSTDCVCVSGVRNRMPHPSLHSTSRVSPIRQRPVRVVAPLDNPVRPRGVVLAHRRFHARAAPKLPRSNRALRLVMSGAVICVAAALSPDAPGPFLLLAVTIFMTAMFGLVSTLQSCSPNATDVVKSKRTGAGGFAPASKRLPGARAARRER
jgi:hypothetical protein